MHRAQLLQAFVGYQCSFLVFVPGNTAWHKSCVLSAGSGSLSTSVVWCMLDGRSIPNGTRTAPQAQAPLKMFQVSCFKPTACMVVSITPPYFKGQPAPQPRGGGKFSIPPPPTISGKTLRRSASAPQLRPSNLRHHVIPKANHASLPAGDEHRPQCAWL